jgi:polar amino acid transport system substrate-binding protein
MKLYKSDNSFFSILVFILLSTSCFNGIASDSPQQVILITDSNYEPYSFVQDNIIKGKTNDWIRRIDEAMPDYSIKLQAMPWREGLKVIRNGKALGIIGTYFAGERRSWIYPYSQPLFDETVVVMCRPGINIIEEPVWPESFKGVLMLNIAGYDGWLDFNIRNRKNTQLMNFLEVPSVDIAYKVLKKNNADCMLSEKAFAKLSIERDTSPVSDKPSIITEISKKSIYIGYSNNAFSQSAYPYALDFAKAFDFALTKLKREGTLVND